MLLTGIPVFLHRKTKSLNSSGVSSLRYGLSCSPLSNSTTCSEILITLLLRAVLGLPHLQPSAGTSFPFLDFLMRTILVFSNSSSASFLRWYRYSRTLSIVIVLFSKSTQLQVSPTTSDTRIPVKSIKANCSKYAKSLATCKKCLCSSTEKNQ